MRSKEVSNPLNNRHDIHNTLWYTELSDLNSTRCHDTDQFLLKFMKGRVRERKAKVKKFRNLFNVPLCRAIQWNLKDMIDDQMRQDIWRAEDEHR